MYNSISINYAKLNNIEIVKEFYDKNIKGKDPIGSRAGFSELLVFCEEQDIHIILFENASRFSRDQIVQELGYRELTKSGYQLVCVDAPQYFEDDTNSPCLKLIRQILGSVAEFQKDELVIKLRGARNRKRLINKVNGILTLNNDGKCEGRKSYLETDPTLVKYACKLRDKNFTLKQISDALFILGYTNSRGNKIHPEQIRRFINYGDKEK